jgi:hypothetical protein
MGGTTKPSMLSQHSRPASRRVAKANQTLLQGPIFNRRLHGKKGYSSQSKLGVVQVGVFETGCCVQLVAKAVVPAQGRFKKGDWLLGAWKGQVAAGQ